MGRHGSGSLAIAVAVVIGLAMSFRLFRPHLGSGDLTTSADEIPAKAALARVASHVDGDTIRLVGQAGSELLAPGEETRVRLLEVDTPELGRPGAPGECYADEASEALREMLPVGAKVHVEADEELLDPYGRTLLYLWTSRGEFVNLELVRQGYARAVLYEPNDEHIEQLRRAEAAARADDLGLWGACG
ncbi:MAG TPA: thermonuclease family protein [Nocardioidaceae bacterium]|nr:thermonuclease family protein [Nocardioidaceae bacterium]